MSIFDRSMAEALRLTRSGKLADATILIQAALRGSPPTARPKSAVVIDLQPVRPSPGAIGRDGATVKSPRVGSAADGGTAASFGEHRYAGPDGALNYRLYVPAAAVAGMPLLVMLHGCTQTPEDFARGTAMNGLADEFGILVAYPTQTGAANAQRCWNWFKPAHQQRDRGEPALIAGITRQVIADHSVDPGRVYVAGLSAGGAAAAVMGAVYPDLYAAIGVHSGLACGAARDLPGAMTAMRTGGDTPRPRPKGDRFVPIITFHGDRDTVVAEINGRKIVAAASAAAGGRLRTQAEPGVSAGGRAYTREVSVDARGDILIEQWTIHGAGHAWSGGDGGGSYTDPAGPDASREMLRFFLQHRI